MLLNLTVFVNGPWGCKESDPTESHMCALDDGLKSPSKNTGLTFPTPPFLKIN